MSGAVILVIEDDPAIRLGLKKSLGFEGYKVLEAADGERGLEMVFQHRPDLVVLDIMLPRLNGYEVCRTIRKHDLGADDYVTKPFGPRELVSRIKAALRRTQAQDLDVKVFRSGRIEVDIGGQSLKVDGEAKEVSTREFRLLRYLIENRGRVLSRDQILNKVWGYDYDGTARTIDNFINKLRSKIELDATDPRMILTVRGVGYKFAD